MSRRLPLAEWWMRPDRVDLTSCTICQAKAGQPCDSHRPDFVHIGRYWDIGITECGNTFHVPSGTEWPARQDHCTPTIESRHVHARQHMRYRGACLCCGWVGQERSDSNLACEDAHDHALPRWRDLPITTRRPDDPKIRTVWDRKVNADREGRGFDQFYLLGWGGPLLTLRDPHGTRSHFVGSGVGYDLCVGLLAPEPARAHAPAAAPEQLCLL